MKTSRFFLLTACCAALFCLADAAKKGKPGKFKNYGPVAMKKDMLAFRAELDEMKKNCLGSNVHFFFHGEGDHEGHQGHDQDDVHVHVDLHLDRKGHAGGHGDGDDHDHIHSAHCQFTDGYARIIQRVPHDKFAKIQIAFSKLDVEVLDVHVHTYGDLSQGCNGLGGHSDPSDPDREIGDIGSIRPDSDNIGDGVWFNNTKLSLVGQQSILGGSIIGHDGDGNIVTCCVIGRAADDHDHDHHDGHDHHDHDHDHHDHDRDHDHESHE